MRELFLFLKFSPEPQKMTRNLKIRLDDLG